MANNYDKTNIASMEMIYGEGYQDCRKWTEIRTDALAHGGIGQSLFRAE